MHAFRTCYTYFMYKDYAQLMIASNDIIAAVGIKVIL